MFHFRCSLQGRYQLLTQREIDEIKERCELATEGPWVWAFGAYSEFMGWKKMLEEPFPGLSEHKVMDDGSACGEYVKQIHGQSPDGRFIAASRTDIPSLIETVEEMKKCLEIYANAHKGGDNPLFSFLEGYGDRARELLEKMK